jgi:hypothetical protein
VPPAGATTEHVTPNLARTYDYLIGGSLNYAADREAAEEMLVLDPGLTERLAQGRRFLLAAVTRACQAGIGQVIDLGAGLPVSPSVTAAAADAEAVTVSCDVDEMAAAHLMAHAARAYPGSAAGVHADLADPDAVLGDPAAKALLDLDESCCLIFGSVAQYWDSATFRGIVQDWAGRVAPGSWIVMSVPHFADEGLADGLWGRFGGGIRGHSACDVAGFLEGLTLVPPGITGARRWLAGISGLSHGGACLLAAVAVKS